MLYFYPRSPCGKRQNRQARRPQKFNFYPRSPCGKRPRAEHHASSQQEFLSTLSLRKATGCFGRLAVDLPYFYPRSPCGKRRWLRCWQLAARDISIHALLAESDNGHEQAPYTVVISIHALLAESDYNTRSDIVKAVISIHALLAESDGQNISWPGIA